MQLQNDIVRNLHNRYSQYLSSTRDWRISLDRARKFYFNDQWDTAVAEHLLKIKQNAMVINRIRPFIRMKASMLMLSSPIGQVIGIDDSDIDAAMALQDLAEYVLQISNWKIILERMSIHTIREGIYWLRVYNCEDADYGNGELFIEGLPYEEVFLPPNSNNIYFDDTEIIVSKLLTKEQYYTKYKKVSLDESLFYQPLNNDTLWGNGMDIPMFSGSRYSEIKYDIKHSVLYDAYNNKVNSTEYVRVFYSYSYKYQDIRVLVANNSGIIKEIPDDYKLSQIDKQAISSGLISDTVVKQKRVLLIEAHSNKFVSKKIIPISFIPVVPIISEDTGTSMPYGDTFFVEDTQSLINKMASLMVLNLALGSNYRVITDLSGTSYSIDKFKKEFSKPGSVIDLPRDLQTGKFPIEIIRPDSLSQAHYQLMMTLFSQVEHGLSMFNLRLGNPETAPETFGGMLQLGQWSDQALEINFNRLASTVERLYYIIFSWAPFYYTKAKAFAYSTNNQLRENVINATKKDNDGKIVYINNISQLRGRFRVQMTKSEVQNQRTINILMQLLSAKPELIDEIINRLPIDNKQEILKKVDTVQKLMTENQQLQEAMKRIAVTMQSLANENGRLRRVARSKIPEAEQ